MWVISPHFDAVGKEVFSPSFPTAWWYVGVLPGVSLAFLQAFSTLFFSEGLGKITAKPGGCCVGGRVWTALILLTQLPRRLPSPTSLPATSLLPPQPMTEVSVYYVL